MANAIINKEFHRGILLEGDAANKLLIDYDHSPPKFQNLIRQLSRLGIKPRCLYYRPSNTKGHWHIVIYMREKMPLLARIFCQLWLGSDPERERNNFVRCYFYKRIDEYSQILFERKIPYE